MQATIISFYKNSKLSKSQSLNQPTKEEEESSKEKECDNDIDQLLYNSNFFVSPLQTSANLAWHITKINFYSYTSDILIPPPKA